MVSQKQIGEAILAMNHNTTEMKIGLAKLGEQHTDIVNELKNANSNHFKVIMALIVVLGALIGLTKVVGP